MKIEVRKLKKKMELFVPPTRNQNYVDKSLNYHLIHFTCSHEWRLYYYCLKSDTKRFVINNHDCPFSTLLHMIYNSDLFWFWKSETQWRNICRQWNGFSGYSVYMGCWRTFANPMKASGDTCAPGLTMLTASLFIAHIWSLVWYHSYYQLSMDSLSANKISFSYH